MLIPRKDKKIVPDFTTQRANMVKFQLQARGIQDKYVLEAMNKVPRHLFGREDLRDQAYADYRIWPNHLSTLYCGSYV
jgi:protein-L-isoaspartate O-methyltransferase